MKLFLLKQYGFQVTNNMILQVIDPALYVAEHHFEEDDEGNISK